MENKKIALFTGNRAEYGLQIPILRAIKEHPNLEYILIVSGAHLDPSYGKTIEEIKSDGFNIHEEIDIGDGGKDLFSTSHSIGSGICEITKAIEKHKPDIFIVYADRFESFAASIAASQTNTITVHIEGGDLTEGGALDDSVRHAMTKLCHFHCVTNKESHDRVISMGEETWRVHTVGYPAIDLIENNEFIQPDDIGSLINININQPIIIFTQHSVTNKYEEASNQLMPSIEALQKLADENYQVIITYPNNDAGGNKIYNKLQEYSNNNNIFLRQSLGRKLYWGILNLSKQDITPVVCVGNSSSGIKETGAFGCPAVNIGSRQSGRLRGENIIDVGYNINEIYDAVKKSLTDDAFIRKCKGSTNPYGIGGAGKSIAKIVNSIELNDISRTKKMTI